MEGVPGMYTAGILRITVGIWSCTHWLLWVIFCSGAECGGWRMERGWAEGFVWFQEASHQERMRLASLTYELLEV